MPGDAPLPSLDDTLRHAVKTGACHAILAGRDYAALSSAGFRALRDRVGHACDHLSRTPLQRDDDTVFLIPMAEFDALGVALDEIARLAGSPIPDQEALAIAPGISASVARIREQLRTNLTYFEGAERETLDILQSHVETQLREIEQLVGLPPGTTAPNAIGTTHRQLDAIPDHAPDHELGPEG